MARLRLWMRERRAGLVPWAVLLLVGCFSTIGPDVEDPESGAPSDDPTRTSVTGLTMHKFATGDIKRRSNWSVEVRWYQGEITQDNLAGRTIVTSNNEAVYTASTTNSRVTNVVVRPILCSYDPDDPRLVCCVRIPNPCGECPAVWGNQTILEARLGLHHKEINLVVNCSGQ